MSDHSQAEPPTDAIADVAPSPNYPAYETARSLIPICESLIPVMDDLAAHYALNLDILHGVAVAMGPLLTNMPDDAPLTGIYTDLLEMSHIARTLQERNAQIDRPDMLTPRRAAQLLGEFTALTLLAMELDDRVGRMAAVPSTAD